MRVCYFIFFAIAVSADTFCAPNTGTTHRIAGAFSNSMDERIWGGTGTWEEACKYCGDQRQLMGTISAGWSCVHGGVGMWLKGCSITNTCPIATAPVGCGDVSYEPVYTCANHMTACNFNKAFGSGTAQTTSLGGTATVAAEYGFLKASLELRADASLTSSFNEGVSCSWNVGAGCTLKLKRARCGSITSTVCNGDPALMSTCAGANQLNGGKSLTAGQILSSDNGRYRVTLQSDGNLVLVDMLTSTRLWNTGTTGATRAIMQTDGNLVLYSSTNAVKWASGTWGNAGSYLRMQDDGNLVIYTPTSWSWASHTYQG